MRQLRGLLDCVLLAVPPSASTTYTCPAPTSATTVPFSLAEQAMNTDMGILKTHTGVLCLIFLSIGSKLLDGDHAVQLLS